jgi:hypothetical protein
VQQRNELVEPTDAGADNFFHRVFYRDDPPTRGSRRVGAPAQPERDVG